MMLYPLCLTAALALGAELAATAQAPYPANTTVAASLDGAEPAGVVLSDDDRLFLTLPRVGQNHALPSVVEMVNGQPVAFPSKALTEPSAKPLTEWLVSPLGLTIAGRMLWVLDEGKRAGIDGIPNGAAKLVGIDIDRRQVVKTIVFHTPFFRPTMQLNDLRFDPTHGSQGTMYISNNGYSEPDYSLLVVDVASGRMREVFKNQPEVSPAPGYWTFVEGQPHRYRDQHPTMPQGGVNGIELSPDKSRLYWTTPTNPNYYSLPTADLSNQDLPEDQLRQRLRFEGQTASNGGITIDPAGTLYFGDASRYAIHSRDAAGNVRLVAYDPRLIWPDGMFYHQGFVYVSIGQWQRAPGLHGGQDLRRPPYQVLKIKVD